MKSRFEKKLKEDAYKLVPDIWENIKPNDIQSLNTHKKRPVIRSIIAIAASVCVIAGIAWALVTQSFNYKKDISAPDEPVKNDTVIHSDEPIKYSDNIIWAGTIRADEDDGGYHISGDIQIDSTLENVLSNAKPNDEFAFVVTLTGRQFYPQDFPTLFDQYTKAEENLQKVADETIEKIEEEMGISYIEAQARMYDDKRFVEARKEFLAIKEKINKKCLVSEYEHSKDSLQALIDAGLKLIYDATNEKYQPYLSLYNGIAVMSATKEKLENLEGKVDREYRFHAATENAEKFRYYDDYSFGEVHLEKDLKITTDLNKAYKENDNKPLRVIAHIVYEGEEFTPEQAEQMALKELGLTAEEYYSTATMAVVDKYREIYNRLINHTDFNEEVVERLLNEGELIELRNISATFTALLSYERAIQLSENKEIAYIKLENENADNYYIIGFDDE